MNLQPPSADIKRDEYDTDVGANMNDP